MVSWVDERRFYSEARQRVLEQVVRATVDRLRRHDVTAGTHERRDS